MRKRDITYTARALGRSQGKMAVAWYKMPETAQEAQRILKGMDDKDEAILLSFPQPELEGVEDASYAAVDLMEHLELDVSTPAKERRYRKLFPQAMKDYEKAFTDTVILTIWKYSTDLLQGALSLSLKYPPYARYSAEEFPGVAVRITDYLDREFVKIAIGDDKQEFGMRAERLTRLDEGTYDPVTGQIGDEEW